MSPNPQLSVVVPVRLATRTIRDTLASLIDQCRSASAEVVAVVSERDPSRLVLDELSDSTLRVIVVPGQQGVPQLRRQGILSSHSPWVVITEDHCLFPPDWLSYLAFGAQEGDAVGGPVENGRRSLVGWAQYFTRYSVFMPPVVDGPAPALPGNNAMYSRLVLDSNADLWTDGFWETEFNQAIKERNCRLMMSPKLAVSQNQHRGIWGYVSLRYRHGRCYGGRRFQAATIAERRRLLLRIPFISAILFIRAARAVFRKGRNRLMFCLASPLLTIYFTAWAVGEAIGYLLGTGTSCLDTD